MTGNIGNIDRVIRLVIPIAIVLLCAFKIVTGTLSLALLIVAGILALTSIAGICPLYKLLGVNTCRKKITGKSGGI